MKLCGWDTAAFCKKYSLGWSSSVKSTSVASVVSKSYVANSEYLL